MNDNNSNATKSIPDVQNPSSSLTLHSIANVANNLQRTNQHFQAMHETAPSTSRSAQRSTKRRHKHTKKAPASSDEPNSASDNDPVPKKSKDTLCIAKEQSLEANVPANDQSMDTTAPLPEDEDEALSQEVYEILKRSYS